MARRAATNKTYCDQQRRRLAKLGLVGRQLIEQLVADLMRRGCRPREAWRLACGFTQEQVADGFNKIKGQAQGGLDTGMRGSRICEYEKWSAGGVRPSVPTLTILAAVYEITWDRLVDIDDLEKMPHRDREAFLEISGPHVTIPEPRRGGLASLSGDGSRVGRPPVAVPEVSAKRSGGGLPGEVTHFTGRDGPMAELRSHIVDHVPSGTVVSIYAIDGMAGVGRRRLLGMLRRSSLLIIRTGRSGSISTVTLRACSPVSLRGRWSRCCFSWECGLRRLRPTWRSAKTSGGT
jgi:transcriptional regulator with XRE-family HTH domain